MSNARLKGRAGRERTMSYSKAGKVKDFVSQPQSPRNWRDSVHAALVGVCVAFVVAVIFGLVP
ncbi:MAG: hypothetical protein DI595_05205 [Agrobacterium fabrum]|uniref:Uncharacterized protein n=1 Tax=Agrobacterium fabrum TaxID=1176649 RepID=A0A2W5FH04_9HYPH|nr:MAG: hypothetical protein DI595_05205 [Agrobacterium fabrum]